MADMNPATKAEWERLGIALAAGKLDEAKSYIVPLVESAEAQQEADASFNAEDLEFAAWFHLGNALMAAGRHADAEAAFRECVDVVSPRVEQSPDDEARQDQLAQAAFNLGNALLATQRNQEAGDRFRMAIGMWQRLLGSNPAHLRVRHDVARGFFNLAYARHEHPAEAVDAYKQSQLHLRRLLRREEHEVARFDLARSGFNLSLALQQVAEADESLRTIQDAIADFEELIRRYPGRPHYEQHLADAKKQAEGLTQTLAEHRQPLDEAIAALPRILPEKVSGDVAEKLRAGGSALLSLAQQAEQAFRPDLAEIAYRRAHAYFASLKSADPQPTSAYMEAASAYDLGILYRDLGRPDSAEHWQRHSIRLLENLVAAVPNERSYRQLLADSFNNLGILLQNSVRLGEAEEAYERARGLREGLLKEQADDRNLTSLGGTLCNLGNIARDRFDRPAALSFYDQALRRLDEVLGRDPQNALAKSFRENAVMGRETVSTQQPPPEMPFSGMASSSPSYLGPRPWMPPEMDAHWVEQLLAEAHSLKPEAGWTSLQRVFPAGKSDANAWYMLGLARGGFLRGMTHEREPWDERRSELALEAFAQAIELKPDFGEAWLYRGIHQYQRFQVSQSTLNAMWGALQRVHEAHRRQLFDPLQRWARDTFLRTRDSLQCAAELLPDTPLPLLTLAKMYREIGDEPHVIESLREALRRDASAESEVREEFAFVEAEDLEGAAQTSM